jgi:hypothetical protein
LEHGIIGQSKTDREEKRDSRHSAIWFGLPDVYRAFILIAHADRQTTSQGSELRPYNWDISVQGERWQSRSCWRYSRRKKWEGLSSNSNQDRSAETRRRIAL